MRRSTAEHYAAIARDEDGDDGEAPLTCGSCGRAECPMLRRGDAGPALEDCRRYQYEHQLELAAAAHDAALSQVEALTRAVKHEQDERAELLRVQGTDFEQITPALASSTVEQPTRSNMIGTGDVRFAKGTLDR